MNDKIPHIEQKAEGSGNAQAAGDGATAISFLGIPIERILMAELVAIILVQCLGYTVSFATNSPAFCIMVLGECFPVIFGLPAAYGLVMGISIRNKKIVIMSLVSASLSLLVMGPLVLCGGLTNFVQWFGSR